MAKLKKRLQKFQLALFFAGIVFLILVATVIILAIGIAVLQSHGIPIFEDTSRFPLFWLAAASLVIGTVIAFSLSRIPLKPIREVCAAADRIADGDYSVRLHLKGPEAFVQLSDRFNHMARELGSVEMLRSDFVNNFSHEFKTPIVSIRGFAKMLKRNDLTPEEREEYLDTIITESERLAGLSANVLNLTQLEQQSILTGKTSFNVSEQIRLAIAMLSDKWQEKALSFDFDCGEICMTGNEEMIKQMWINLLDNAIKFSPAGKTIRIRLQRAADAVTASISNEGSSLSEESAKHIFDRFYQGDLSHAAGGYGLGLAIVKRIVALHGGTIFVKTGEASTITFHMQFPF